MTARAVDRVAVVGSGLMGHGIAQEFAACGHDVDLIGRSDDSLDRAAAQMRQNLDRLSDLGVFDRSLTAETLDRVRPATDLNAAAEADVVIEAVYENLALKRSLFRRLDEMCPPETALASTTSTFSASEIAAGAVRRDRILVAHYVNPPYLTPLVEIVPSAETSQAAVETVRELLAGMGKQPVVLSRETPGFVSVRLQAALLREALSLVEGGTATPQAVDTVIRTSIGRRWAVAGVFEVLDLAGWDTVSAIAEQLFPALDASTDPAALRERVDRGELGVKSGRGFYDWTPERAEAARRRIARALVEIERWEGPPS